MANQNQPSGLAPVRYLNGAPWTGGGNIYCILAADTNAFWIGDPVTTIGNSGGDTLGLPTVTLAAAGAATRGVIVGLGTNRYGPYVNPGNLNIISRPLGAALVPYYALVVDDPNVIFEIQNGGTLLTTAAISRNCNFNTGTRNAAAVPALSPAYLDGGTAAGTATLNCKILQAVQRPDNVPFATYNKFLVTINSHEFRAGTASS